MTEHPEAWHRGQRQALVDAVRYGSPRGLADALAEYADGYNDVALAFQRMTPRHREQVRKAWRLSLSRPPRP